MIKKLVNKFGYRQTKIGMIAVTAIMGIFFILCVVLAVRNYIDFNTYTKITM